MTETKIKNLFQQGIKYDKAGKFAQSILIHKKLAELGHIESMFNYGWAFHEGYGVEKDMSKSFEWMLKAANKGHSGAQFNVGVFYDTGLVIKQDFKKAFEYFMKAAQVCIRTFRSPQSILFLAIKDALT